MPRKFSPCIKLFESLAFQDLLISPESCISDLPEIEQGLFWNLILLVGLRSQEILCSCQQFLVLSIVPFDHFNNDVIRIGIKMISIKSVMNINNLLILSS